ncbi:hypothetical protein HYH02_010967 [Chlamydomonas schloesseri]|uniref:BPL/LPL catalytic domain-containing protein n=1 Tax=Chlamydomonas schloesseri TaxID=2026947 RepID=A0A835W5V5_9CHLO|nr:hypothetical protein HYH02_010967 [Chlamydomonas schloesseri]|eukprot:KAG2438269.1 hypothetical protein HYH02_010967 [Chlamydomonas schloesseri]
MAAITTAAASGSAAGGAGGGAAEDGPAHVLVVCSTPEESQRLTAAVKEIAAASPDLVFHTDAASLPPAAWPALDAAACAARLHGGAGAGAGRTMGRALLVASVLGSTQELLRAHGSALGDGAVVVADRQTSGKGRGGNQWTSPLGCLMFSALRRLRVQSPAQAPFINYLVCLAVTRGVRAALQSLGLPALDVRIKWPNDIYASGVKIAGALIHTTWQGNCFNVITGIGLNVNNRQPTTCLDELLEKAAAAAGGAPPAAPLPREVVLAEILAAMDDVFNTFEAQGFPPLEPEYQAAWLHSGQCLDFDDSDPSQGISAPHVRLTIRGLSPAGFLLAVDEAGQRYELTPDGNSLDMMRGLLRRKLPA